MMAYLIKPSHKMPSQLINKRVATPSISNYLQTVFDIYNYLKEAIMPTLQPQAFRKVFSVTDYGATGIDDGTDDTQFINDALAAIVAYDTSIGHGYPASGALVPYIYILYFPTGIYRISSTIEMGGSFQGLTISGDGAIIKPIDGALFQEAGQDVFAFQHNNCYNAIVEGMSFVGFKKVFSLTLPGGLEAGKAIVRDCKFHDNTVLSLELACNSGIFVVEDCKFFNNKQDFDILSGGIEVIVKNCWIHPANGLDGVHSCVIKNGARLLMEDCVLVPGQPSSSSIEPAWINNYGSVLVKNTRQGGEDGSFTLVNNFAGVGGDLADTYSVIVKDSLCYAIWNDFDSNNANYFPPAILRYVTCVPNLTSIQDNQGMKNARILGFSKYLWNDDPTQIQENVIQASGTPETINNFFISVKVSNNIGGYAWDSIGNLIPQELFPFVRDKADLWPYKPAISLERLNPPNPNDPDDTTGLVDSNGTRIFKFEYPIDNNIDTALLVNFSGCILGAGSSAYYRGGFVGIIKANGVWNNNSFQKALIMETLFNQIGEANSFPNGNFGVDVYWDESSTEVSSSIFLPDGSTNRNFYIRIAGLQGYDTTNTITVTPIDTFMLGQF